jgi:hypothetical protein
MVSSADALQQYSRQCQASPPPEVARVCRSHLRRTRMHGLSEGKVLEMSNHQRVHIHRKPNQALALRQAAQLPQLWQPCRQEALQGAA